ncbi:MAG TPA: protein kinase [Anaerolineales bacterium]
MFENLVGQTLDRYTILRRIGEDAIGVIFLARDANLQRDFALKVIDPSITELPNFIENFNQAASAAAHLDHPNLIQVFGSGQALGVYYLVLETIPGPDLEQMLADLHRDGQWVLMNEAVQLVRQLALAMEYVRSQGAPQRTLKPASVSIKPVPSDRLPYLPVITDLGLARLAADGPGRSPVLAPAYLSPEAALGRNTDPRSDVYQLGVLLYELVAGQLPFPIQTFDDAVRYHTRQPLQSPATIRPDMPEPLAAAIIRAMDKDPEARFSSPAALATELESLTPLTAALTTPPPAFESAVSLLEPYRNGLNEEPEEVPPAAATIAAPAVAAPIPAATQISPAHPAPGPTQAEIRLEDTQLTVEPGESVTTRVILVNRGSREGQFNLSVEGVPPAWVNLNPQTVLLRPGEERVSILTIQSARSAQSRAGRYPLTVRVIDPQAPGQPNEAKGTLTLGGFSGFNSQLSTRRLVAGQVGQITVNNLSNMPETFSFNFSDPDHVLDFIPPETPLRLSEGQTGVAEFRIGLREPRLIGGDQLHPFIAQVAATNGDTQNLSGEMISRAMIPVWLLAVLALVFLCAGGAAALFLSQSSLQSARATATAAAEQTGIASALLAPTLTAQAYLDQTATAQFLANANQATRQAVTATMAVLSTQTAAAQTATAQVVSALSAATQTALAQQTGATAAAQAVGATQTAAVQQATQASAAQIATISAATAAAASNAAQTATASAGATASAQAAGALAATAQAATAQAAAANTATAQAATEAAAAPRRVAYIYLTTSITGTAEARDYQVLLQGNNYLVDPISQDAIASTNFSSYHVIIIGPDTGNRDVWGDPGGSQAGKLIASGLPILGLGEGGYAFFGRAHLPIGFDNGILASGTSVEAVDPGSPVWSTPNKIPLPANRVLALYLDNTPLLAVTVQGQPSGLTLIGRLPGDATHYPIVRQGDKSLLWGYVNGPTSMTAEGQQEFINIVKSLIP